MEALLGLPLEVPRSPLDHLDPVVLERLQHLLEVERARTLLIQRKQDHGEGALELRVAIELIEDDVGLMPLLDLEHEP